LARPKVCNGDLEIQESSEAKGSPTGGPGRINVQVLRQGKSRVLLEGSQAGEWSLTLGRGFLFVLVSPPMDGMGPVTSGKAICVTQSTDLKAELIPNPSSTQCSSALGYRNKTPVIMNLSGGKVYFGGSSPWLVGPIAFGSMVR
jgi:hypothetical protein